MGRWVRTSLWGWGWTCAAFTALVAFMRSSGGSFFVAFRAIVAFMGRWRWTFVACTVFLLFMESLGWTFVAFMRRSGWYFLIFFVAWRSVVCSVYGAFGWDPCGVHNVCSDYKALGLLVFCGI